MNTLMDINPWNFLNDLLDSESRSFKILRNRSQGRYPPVNVFLDDNAMIIDIELPGKTAKDVELTLEAQSVTLADKPVVPEGDEKPKTPPPKPAWSRSLELPYRVDAEKASAVFKNGILRIELPKVESKSAHRIAITNG